MDPENSDYEQDKELPLATTDTLRPLVQLFLVQLTSTQWASVGSGALDEHTENIITEMCVDLINTMSTRIFKLFKIHLAPLKSTELISEEEVQQFLGDSITETFEFVTGGEVPSRSAERVTEIVTKEITERINSQLFNSSEDRQVSEPESTTSPRFTRRLRTMVKHVARMLKRCGATVAYATGVEAADSPETSGTSQSYQEISQAPAAEVSSETMDTENRNHKQDQELPLATTDTLRPLVQLFLAQLTAAQWASVGSGALDENTENIVTEFCVDLVNTMSKRVFELFETHLASLKATEFISEEEVQQFLGDSIMETFEFVTDGEVPSQSAEKVTEIVTKEITERINSQLFNGSEGSQVSEPQGTTGSRFSRRLRTMVKHVTRMLKNCGGKVACANSAPTAAETLLQEISQTPAASLVPEEVDAQGLVYQEAEDIVAQALEEFVVQPEEIAAAETFLTKTTETVMKILSEQASHTDVEFNADISEEEHMEVMSNIIEDTNDAALDIANFIWSNRESFGLNSDGSPKSVASSSSINCWDILANKVKTFFARKFTTEAVVTLIAKLRSTLNCISTKKTQLEVLVPAATEVIQAIIPPDNQEPCIYEEMALCMQNDERQLSRKLEEVILDSIRPDHGSSTMQQFLVVKEVDNFMTTMWRWLNQQVQQHGVKTNRAKDSFKNIKRFVMHLPERSEEEPEEQAPPSTSVEPGVRVDEEDIPVTTGNNSEPPSITAEPDVSDDEEDISDTAGNEFKPLFITAETEVSDDEEDELIDEEDKLIDREDEFIDEEDDIAEIVPANVTAEPAISGSAKQSQSTDPEGLFYVSMVSAVLNQIFKTTSCQMTLSHDDITEMSSSLALTLWAKLAGSDFVKPSPDKIKRIARAVHKELSKTTGSKGCLAMNLRSKDSLIYDYVAEVIKRHLVKPKKTGVKGFFNSFFKIVSKPFRACFTRG